MDWASTWAETTVGIQIRTTATSGSEQVEDLVGVGLRRSTKRRHLLVSGVLGKHIPAEPQAIYAAGTRLGGLVADALVGQSAIVVGFAETATLLGRLVADALGARYIHSTRRFGDWAADAVRFSETHSHAPQHALQPWPATFMDGGEVAVLVDDEVSTARTALAMIEALHRRAPRHRYLIASLVDMSSAADRRHADEFASQLGISLARVSLAAGSISIPDEIATPASAGDITGGLRAYGQVRLLAAPWPSGVRECGRHGTEPHHSAFDQAITATARAIADVLPEPQGRTRVLGAEELMYAPFRIAGELPGSVQFSSTTRSPAVVIDSPGYPIRSGITFTVHEADAAGSAGSTGSTASAGSVGSAGERYVYNLNPGEQDQIVLVVDEHYATALPPEMARKLAALAPFVLIVTIPTYRPPRALRGPEFGSYPPADIAWLLTDLSGIALEAAMAERERSMQGDGHYAETLPIEYQPGALYLELFEAALTASAGRVAAAVASVGEQIIAARGRHPVVASLARAGTPVGVLMRRWAKVTYGLDWPHYSISIVRGRGIDEMALGYLAARHDSRDVVFVDGWTGKGAIARELSNAIAAVNRRLGTAFDDTLAVLADPAYCTSMCGTRDDFLIPSACLNSTVSGLVSRTVLNRELIRRDQFHGAKYYRELRPHDVSSHLIDTIAGHFPGRLDGLSGLGGAGARVAFGGPGGAPAAIAPTSASAIDPPDWRGWAASELIAAEYGISDLNLIKPGVGETTRVLLRRIPWKVLVRPDRADDLAHIHFLAAERGVELVPKADLAFSCVGIIRPAARGGAA